MATPFAQVGPAMLDLGYSPIPIMPGHKVPGTYANGDWRMYKGWNEFCTKRPTKFEVEQMWSTWPNAGVGVACGMGLICIDIDQEEIIAPLREVLPACGVQKKGRKGISLFYRGDTDRIRSKNYRTPERVGLVDLLAEGKQTVLPPSVHPDTAKPYEWTTARTLLDTPLAKLPEITVADVAALESVLQSHGWEAPESARPRRETVVRSAQTSDDVDMLWHDDVNTVALANLSAWVDALGLPKGRWQGSTYRAVAPWRSSGSGRDEAQRSRNLSFHPTGIFDFGDRGWTPTKVVAKSLRIPNPAAAAWLRQRLGLPDQRLILANAGAVKPTYPDRAVPLADATTELCNTLGSFEAEMKAWRIYRNAAKIKAPLIHRKPPVWGVKIETGGGKSFQGARKVAEWTKRGWRLAYVTPRITTSDDIARDLAGLGINARVYRGREQDDPDASDKTMCQNLPAAKAAIALGLSVRPAVCMRRVDEKLVKCLFANVCGHEKQREARPEVWIITSANLPFARPDFFAELDGLVVDERFFDKAIGKPVAIDTIELWHAKIEMCSDVEHNFLTDMRAKLGAVVDANGNGPLSRDVLYEHGVFPNDALRAATLEQRRVKPDILRPNMSEPLLNHKMDKYGTRNKLARDTGSLWDEIALFLTFGQSLSGRITVEGTSLALTPLQTFHPSWLAPMIVLDATLTTSGVLDAAVFGDEILGIPSTVALKADIAIQWPEYVRVRQITDAPVSMNKLGIGKRAKPHPRNERDILRYILQRAALVAPARLGVISYLGLEERFAGRVPANVVWMHFGATSGSNNFETVAGLVIIGRWWNSPKDVEATASIFAGYPVKPIGEEYLKRTGGIRTTEGRAVPAIVEFHPDPFAEAIRHDITEGELTQAIGRLRPHRRSEPCFLDILGDVVLPITVDEVVEWDDIKPGAVADMMAEGVVLANVADAQKAFKVSDGGARGVGGIVIGDSYKQTIESSPFRKVRYQKVGGGQKPYDAWLLPGILPGGPAVLRAWLEARLGCELASLTVERIRARDSKTAQALFAKIQPNAEARATRPLAGFSSLLGSIKKTVKAMNEDDADDESEINADDDVRVDGEPEANRPTN